MVTRPGDIAASLLGVLGVLAVHSAAFAADLRDIRCIGGRDYTRLVLDLSGRVPFQIHRSAAASGAPARVYVDLAATRMIARDLAPCAGGGPLRQLRVARTDQGLRLVLDVADAATARAFPLPDPFRLVVDVEVSAAPPSPTGPSAPAAMAGRGDARSQRFTVVLDPGHGGKDPGALGVAGIQEKDVALAIALRLREQLRALPNVTVALTRDHDEFLSLEERTARANAAHADLFLSIHANASPHSSRSGIETYYLNNTNDRATLRLAAMENGVASAAGGRQRSREVSLLLSSLIQDYKLAQSATFAETVQRALVRAVGAHWSNVTDLGVKQGPFYVLEYLNRVGPLCLIDEPVMVERGGRVAAYVTSAAVEVE